MWENFIIVHELKENDIPEYGDDVIILLKKSKMAENFHKIEYFFNLRKHNYS